MCDATKITELKVLNFGNHLYIVTFITNGDSDSNFVSVLIMGSLYRNVILTDQQSLKVYSTDNSN